MELWIKKDNKNKPEPYYEYPSGTGFFIISENNLFLVTAEHVSKNLTPSAWVVIYGENNNPLRLSFNDFGNFKKTIPWIVHSEADVAVLPLKSSTKHYNVLKKHFIPLSVLSSEKHAPSRDDRLVVIGFPLGLGSK